MNVIKILSTIVIISLLFGCSKNENNNPTAQPFANIEVPSIYNKIYRATSITNDGTFLQ